MSVSSSEQDLAASSEIEWRRPLQFAFPAAALAFLIGVLLDRPSGQGNTYDYVTYPAALILLLILSILLWWRPSTLNRLVTVLVFAMSGFFLGKLIYILYLLPQNYHVQLEMTETFFWIPALQILSFFIPDLRGARGASTIFFSLFLLISGIYIISEPHIKQREGIIYALLELNLANIMLFVVTRAFIGFKEKYVQSMTERNTMRQMINTDHLTGLPNRHRLDRVLLEAIAQETPFCLLFIDLDGFKLVNDTLGHLIGDRVLQEVAQRLQQQSGLPQFAARLSGDEFVVQVFAHPERALAFGRKLSLELAQPIVVEGHIIQLSASIGMSVHPEDGGDVQSLIQHADSAMYTVKSFGKHGIRRYESETDAAIERLNQIERALTGALRGQELYLMYQPIYSLKDGIVRKLETLLRWTHPTLGEISAAEFIPIAENNGQIIAIGNWALRSACEQARRWNDLTGLAVTVSVNVSPLQFIQSNFVELVKEALSLSQLPASALEIELTESAVMRRLDMVKSSLQALQMLGVKIAIDDFGTGYSSLSYLRDLPINCIKIDQSFIRDLSTPRRAPQFALALIEAVLGIAETLELEVVAEGIETRKQLEMIRDLGCPLGQGFFLSRPLQEDAVLEAYRVASSLLPPPMSDSLH